MDAYGLRGSGDINFSWLWVREFAIVNHSTSPTMTFNVGWGADESKNDGYIDYNAGEIIGQNQTVSVPSGISLSDFHWVRVIARGLVDGYDDAVIVHFMQGDDVEEVVYADGVSTGGGGSREVAVYMESEGEATGTTHVAFFREYTTPPMAQLPFPDDGGRR
jgi:hypothetical protein